MGTLRAQAANCGPGRPRQHFFHFPDRLHTRCKGVEAATDCECVGGDEWREVGRGDEPELWDLCGAVGGRLLRGQRKDA